MFVLILFAVFAEQLSVITLANYQSSIFADEDKIFATLIMVFGHLSYLVSGFLQGAFLDKIGKIYLREIMLFDLLLNGLVTASMAILPARLGVFWVILKFFSVILTSSYYAHFAVEYRFTDKTSRSMGNSLVFIAFGLASMFSVILPIARSSYDRAFFTVSSVHLIVVILILAFYDNTEIFGKSKDLDNADRKSVASDIEKPCKPVKQLKIWDALGSFQWIQMAFFIILKNVVSTLVFANILHFIPKRFECDSADISMIRLILTIAAMIVGSIFVFVFSKISVKTEFKLTLLFLAFVSIAVCSFFFDQTLPMAICVASCFAVIDFCLGPMIITIITEFSESFPASMQAKILSITLSLANIGSCIGPYLAQLDNTLLSQYISYSIMSTAFICLLILIVLLNKKKSPTEKNEDDFLTHFEKKEKI